jgi:hypothetical protein
MSSEPLPRPGAHVDRRPQDFIALVSSYKDLITLAHEMGFPLTCRQADTRSKWYRRMVAIPLGGSGRYDATSIKEVTG